VQPLDAVDAQKACIEVIRKTVKMVSKTSIAYEVYGLFKFPTMERNYVDNPLWSNRAAKLEMLPNKGPKSNNSLFVNPFKEKGRIAMAGQQVKWARIHSTGDCYAFYCTLGKH